MNVDNQLYFALVEEQLKERPLVRLTLQGTSMMPTLREGDVLTLGRLEADPVVGDIVLFRYPGGHRLHRIVGRKGDLYRLQGDHSQTCEEVGIEAIVALLKGVERGGKAVNFAHGRLAAYGSTARRLAYSVLGREGRRRLRPWYFFALAFLMWAPLNGIGIPLDNYIFGLRADHLLHASVYLPCTLFFLDLKGWRRWQVWLAAVAVGLLTEGGQYLIPWRGFDINDLVANAMGVTIGWLVVMCVRRGKR